MDTSNHNSILWLTQWHILTYGFSPCHIFFLVSLHIFLWVPSYAIEEDKAEATIRQPHIKNVHISFNTNHGQTTNKMGNKRGKANIYLLKTAKALSRTEKETSLIFCHLVSQQTLAGLESFLKVIPIGPEFISIIQKTKAHKWISTRLLWERNHPMHFLHGSVKGKWSITYKTIDTWTDEYSGALLISPACPDHNAKPTTK